MPDLTIPLSKQLHDRLSNEAGKQGKYKYSVVINALEEWLTCREYSRTLHGNQRDDMRCKLAKK